MKKTEIEQIDKTVLFNKELRELCLKHKIDIGFFIGVREDVHSISTSVTNPDVIDLDKLTFQQTYIAALGEFCDKQMQIASNEIINLHKK